MPPEQILHVCCVENIEIYDIDSQQRTTNMITPILSEIIFSIIWLTHILNSFESLVYIFNIFSLKNVIMLYGLHQLIAYHVTKSHILRYFQRKKIDWRKILKIRFIYTTYTGLIETWNILDPWTLYRIIGIKWFVENDALIFTQKKGKGASFIMHQKWKNLRSYTLDYICTIKILLLFLNFY